MRVLLNRYDNPRLSDQIFVGKGDTVFAGHAAKEYGFTVGSEYKIKSVDAFGYLTMENDKGEVDEYTVEYFQKYRPLVHKTV